MEACGLLQLKHSHNPDEMFGEGYGYRSGLNLSMVEHLRRKVENLMKVVRLREEDVILDIGSNDSTLLQSYPKNRNLSLIGIDPSGPNFKEFYPEEIELIPAYFTRDAVENHIGRKRVKIVTSVAMLYDLESPTSFIRDVYELLADDGIWHTEQSYMPRMLGNNSYDTVCHEHLEYYALTQLKWMFDRVGFKIIRLEQNETNGGSLAITVAKKTAPFSECEKETRALLTFEDKLALSSMRPYMQFRRNVHLQRSRLKRFLAAARREGKTAIGLGASTKGNVILQFCEITEEEIPFVGDVNPKKFGCFTPGTRIPIISEQKAVGMRPDYLVILPWHFRKFFLDRKGSFGDAKLVFPLPKISVE